MYSKILTKDLQHTIRLWEGPKSAAFRQIKMQKSSGSGAMLPHMNFTGQLSVHPSALKKEIFSARYKGMGRNQKNRTLAGFDRFSISCGGCPK